MTDMQIDRVWHFYGPAALPGMFAGDGPWQLTLEDLAGLAVRYAVLLYPVLGQMTLALDTPEGRFRPR